ncbi:MAG: hypothetical protein PHF56_10695 [Desulfuromonadaceae bacterium]|nr:hypothetical protein [Desulfuromonadaceae bacterium]
MSLTENLNRPFESIADLISVPCTSFKYAVPVSAAPCDAVPVIVFETTSAKGTVSLAVPPLQP